MFWSAIYSTYKYLFNIHTPLRSIIVNYDVPINSGETSAKQSLGMADVFCTATERIDAKMNIPQARRVGGFEGFEQTP